MLAETAITGAAGVSVTGNIGLDLTSAAITALGALTVDGSGNFSTSPQVSGDIFALDYSASTTNLLSTAITTLQSAYSSALSETSGAITNTNNGASLNIGGMTFAPGIYYWNAGISIPAGSVVTLNGGPNDVWIFQITGALTIGANSQIVLTGSAQAQNVFWVPASATVGASDLVSGIVMSGSTITFGANSTNNGNLFSQSAITLGAGDIIQ
jgi:hypothetical protein